MVRHPSRVRTEPDAQNPITGPTSALTSFLREQGITGPDGRHARRPQPGQPPAAGPPTAPLPAVAEQDDDDDNDGEREEDDSVAITSVVVEQPAVASTSTAVVASSPKRKTPAETKAEAAAKKKQKKTMDDLAENPWKAPLLNKAGPVASGSGSAGGMKPIPAPGSFSTCSECGKKFTVSKYTPRNPLGPGFLCSPCSKESIENVASSSKPKPKPVRAPKKRAVGKGIEAREKEGRQVTTLQQLCVNVIASSIDRMEDLGDIGPENLDRVAKIVCKMRALNGQNLKLFLNVGTTELHLYDCTNVKAAELASIAAFCPHLERLSLDLCGRTNGSVLDAWGRGLRNLKYLSLYAPFLVTFTDWIRYLESFDDEHQLEGFGLMQSARFDDDCIALLVSRNPNLYNLQLSELGKLNDRSLSLLHPLTNLTTLDISRAGVIQGTVLTDEGVIDLLKHVGKNLVELVLDQNYLLTDAILTNGVQLYCPTLRVLSLSSLSLLRSAPTAAFFTAYQTLNPVGLTRLSLHRCIALENDALLAALDHSGKNLKKLDIHSVDEVDKEGLEAIGERAKKVEWLDVSFVRSTDDFVVKGLLDGLEKLKVLFVHGDNLITDNCPAKRGVSIRGRENCNDVEMFEWRG